MGLKHLVRVPFGSDRRLLSAGRRPPSLRGEELAAALPVPAVGRPGPRGLLHHLPALHPVEPGPVPMPTPHQHVDRESQLGGRGLVNMGTVSHSWGGEGAGPQSNVRPTMPSSLLSLCSSSPSLHLSTSFYPPPPPSRDLSLTPPMCSYVIQATGAHRGHRTGGP